MHLLIAWHEHGQEATTPAAWLEAWGTVVAAGFGVAAFVWQVTAYARGRRQDRRAQARRVWFLAGHQGTAIDSVAPKMTLVAHPAWVYNQSDEVVSWVHLELTPVHQAKDTGEVTRLDREPNDEDGTHQGVAMIGPGGEWKTGTIEVEVPYRLDGSYVWEAALIFEDAAGVRWARTGNSQTLVEKPKTRDERKAEQSQLR